MLIENIIFAFACWGFTLFYILYTRRAIRRERPLNFYTGYRVEPKEISDIPAYNRELGKAYMIFAGAFAVVGAAWLFNFIAGVILFLATCILGVIILAAIYSRIKKKYTLK